MADFAQRPGFRYMDLDDFEEYLADKPENEKWELLGGRLNVPAGARSVRYRFDLVACIRQQPPQIVEHVGIVVGDQHAAPIQLRRRTSIPPGTCSPAATG